MYNPSDPKDSPQPPWPGTLQDIPGTCRPDVLIKRICPLPARRGEGGERPSPWVCDRCHHGPLPGVVMCGHLVMLARVSTLCTSCAGSASLRTGTKAQGVGTNRTCGKITRVKARASQRPLDFTAEYDTASVQLSWSSLEEFPIAHLCALCVWCSRFMHQTHFTCPCSWTDVPPRSIPYHHPPGQVCPCHPKCWSYC